MNQKLLTDGSKSIEPCCGSLHTLYHLYRSLWRLIYAKFIKVSPIKFRHKVTNTKWNDDVQRQESLTTRRNHISPTQPRPLLVLMRDDDSHTVVAWFPHTIWSQITYTSTKKWKRLMMSQIWWHLYDRMWRSFTIADFFY